MFTQTQQAILESIFSRVILEQRGGGGGSEQQPQQQQQQNASAQTSSNEMSSEETESTNIDPNVLQPILESIAPESEAFGLVRFF
jgi:iron only hydrogenase large subunit-like protein